VQDIQVGAVYRAVRRRQGLSQREIAARAGVSQQTVSVIERGRFDEVDLATLRRVGAVLGIDLPFAPRWRGPELDRLLDAGHAAIVEIVVGELRDRGWTVMVEWSFNRYGERGSVDVLAWHPDRSALVVVEVKTRVVDLQGLLGTLDRKVRIAAELLPKERGWRPAAIARIVVLPDTSTSRDAVDRHRATFDAALPGRTIAVRRWLRIPANDLRAVWFLRSTSGAGGPARQAVARGAHGRASRSGPAVIPRDTNGAGENPK
jgi:transcriptional regulator with XRE-family HTH domain